jgi:hypothetical protein
MTTEFAIPKHWDDAAMVLDYLISLGGSTWYWTLPNQLFTFVHEDDAIMFRLRFGL